MGNMFDITMPVHMYMYIELTHQILRHIVQVMGHMFDITIPVHRNYTPITQKKYS